MPAQLFTIPPVNRSGDTVIDVLAKATAYATEHSCTEVLVILQRNDDAEMALRPWFARDAARVETIMFLLETMLFKFNCMIAGIVR